MRPTAKSKIDVLVVDDSALVRQLFVALLTGVGGFEVRVAPDPLIAAAKIERRRPDVIVLDLEMPRQDGLTFLRHLMARTPIPVVICSSYVGQGSAQAMEALQAGAVDLIAKPELGIREFVEDKAVKILHTVRAAARARTRLLVPAKQAAEPKAIQPPPSLQRLSVVPDRILAFGASTGGTEALAKVLSALPANGPAIVLVQHMPASFTPAFATRLDQASAMEVREAQPGDELRAGLALLSPGDHHLEVQRKGHRLGVRLSKGPLVSGHRPSVDILFDSVATAVGPRSVGVLLTGMGADGARGLLAMRQAGAHTVAQDESSSVVFGMPREAIALKAVERVLPLNQIASHALRAACSYKARPR